ncbi:MFS general substrate transporter [Nemania sp. FL0916]|nr:MFS general substrate transporter [Nemania sp. FL0916]
MEQPTESDIIPTQKDDTITSSPDMPASGTQEKKEEDADLGRAKVNQTDSPPAATASTERDEQYHAQGLKLFLILSSLILSVFCQALDDTIIATAIPRITDEFRRLDDVGWYGSAYLLTNASFQLFYGKLYQILPVRLVFLGALLLFEIGSLIAGVAPTSAVLIVGRAIAGTGAAGITSGALNIIAHVTRVQQRPLFVSLIGVIYGVASAIGPILGGALAEKVTWRWNFYINLPLGAVAAVLLLAVLRRLPPSAQGHRLPFRTVVVRLDPVGTFTLIPSITSLLIALQWGNTVYPWSDGRIIALLTVFALLLVIFIVAQVVQDDKNATIPKHIMRIPEVSFGAFFAFFQGSAFNLFIFTIPLYFQAIKNVTPIASGVDYLPLILGNAVFIFVAGSLASRIGSPVPWLWSSSILMSIGAGLLTLLRPDTDTGRWVGFQLLFAIGSGLGFQQPFVITQTVLAIEDIGPGTGIMQLANLGGAAIFVSVALSVFAERLVAGVDALGLDGIDTRSIIQLGATELRQIVPPEYVDQVVSVYNAALVQAYQVGLILSAISIIGPVGITMISIRNKRKH